MVSKSRNLPAKTTPNCAISYFLGRTVRETEGKEAPFPRKRHSSLTNLLGLENNVFLAESAACDLGRIAWAIHLAHPMCAALQRKHPARYESPDDIVRTDVGLLLQRGQETHYPVGFGVFRPWVVAPVGSTGGPRLIWRKIDAISAAGVLHVKESSLPGAARLEAGKLKKSAPLAGADDAGAALHGRLGLGDLLALDGVDPQVEETGKRLTSGTNADVSLHEGGITRKIEKGVARKVVRLEIVEIQEIPEKSRGRKAEAALKVSEKNNILVVFRIRFDLVIRNPAGNSFRNPPRPVQPIDLKLSNVGAHPGSAGGWGRLLAGRLAGAARGLARATGLLATGSLAKATGF
jgi:hypothetical protein